MRSSTNWLLATILSFPITGCTNPEEAPSEVVTVEELDMEPPVEGEVPPADSHSGLVNEAPDTGEGRSSVNSSFGLGNHNPQTRFQVTAGILYIRAGAGEDYGTVGYLREGDAVHVIQILGEWAQIGPKRWVARKFLRATQ